MYEKKKQLAKALLTHEHDALNGQSKLEFSESDLLCEGESLVDIFHPSPVSSFSAAILSSPVLVSSASTSMNYCSKIISTIKSELG